MRSLVSTVGDCWRNSWCSSANFPVRELNWTSTRTSAWLLAAVVAAVTHRQHDWLARERVCLLCLCEHRPDSFRMWNCLQLRKKIGSCFNCNTTRKSATELRRVKVEHLPRVYVVIHASLRLHLYTTYGRSPGNRRSDIYKHFLTTFNSLRLFNCSSYRQLVRRTGKDACVRIQVDSLYGREQRVEATIICDDHFVVKKTPTLTV